MGDAMNDAVAHGAFLGSLHSLIVTSALIVFAIAGCAMARTDIATLNGPGRHEVTLPGAGIMLGGILFRPPITGGAVPAVIVLHGWGEAGRPGAPRVEATARRLSEDGYVALALSLRGWPSSGGRDDCGLEQPDDVAKAADWLTLLSGVDPNRIGVLGFSQGGQVALLAGTRTQRIKAVVAYYPVTDIERWRQTTSHSGIRDFYIPQVCGSGRFNSPVHDTDKMSAAVLLIHGDSDTRVPTEQSLKMRDALQKTGRRVDLLLISGAGHGFSSSESEQAWPSVMKFLRAHLGE
jgi:dipeptidyl aminopeptidase/acylaminoacyl peptidase